MCLQYKPDELHTHDFRQRDQSSSLAWNQTLSVFSQT